MFKMPEYVWRNYLVEFTYYGKRVVQELRYHDVVDEIRPVGSTVTVNVNKQKRIGIIHGIA
jgi:hypothetical protein